MPNIAFISQPMSGYSEEQILAVRNAAVDELNKMGYVVIESYNPSPIDAKVPSLAYLARSLSIMAKCDVVYFVNGFENAKGCRIEEKCAKEYGITRIYEDNTILRD